MTQVLTVDSHKKGRIVHQLLLDSVEDKETATILTTLLSTLIDYDVSQGKSPEPLFDVLDKIWDLYKVDLTDSADYLIEIYGSVVYHGDEDTIVKSIERLTDKYYSNDYDDESVTMSILRKSENLSIERFSMVVEAGVTVFPLLLGIYLCDYYKSDPLKGLYLDTLVKYSDLYLVESFLRDDVTWKNDEELTQILSLIGR